MEVKEKALNRTNWHLLHLIIKEGKGTNFEWNRFVCYVGISDICIVHNNDDLLRCIDALLERIGTYIEYKIVRINLPAWAGVTAL